MLAARLHGPEDLRVEEIPHPGAPGPGQVLLRVKAVGICGSDRHTYRHAAIGDIRLEGPLILGHEFTGVLEEVGEGALDGQFRPLSPGTRVAVDPAQPCGRCELCEQGHANLCLNLRFCGLWPDQGAMCEWMHVPAGTCFPIPAEIDDAAAVMLEPLGIAIHTVDLAKVRVGHSAAVLGAGPIGLCILQVLRLSGAHPIFVTDKLPWRVELARQLGATETWSCDQIDPVEAVREATAGRGVDVAIEAAWCDASLDQAAAMVRHGGRLLVVGIPEDDCLRLSHSVARRKGLSILMVRRMKHVYPRAIGLAAGGGVALARLVSHRFPLRRAAEAFAAAAEYRQGVVKVLVEA
ncbi:MAG: zinc-dependent alcohol dehydrogenase [Thermoguttaceae bacterium]